MKRVLVLALAGLAVLALAGVVALPEGAQAVEPPPAARTVTVVGTGSVEAVPDRARFSFAVESRAATAKAALAANAAEVRKVLAAVKAAGATEVGTEWVSVGPISGENGQIQGWSASNAVGATIAVARAGALVDAAVEAGANSVSGPGLTSSEATALGRRALVAAVADAKARAAVLAEAAGGSLGAVRSLTEAPVGIGPQPAYDRAALEAGTPIEPGVQRTTASVTVTYELR